MEAGSRITRSQPSGAEEGEKRRSVERRSRRELFFFCRDISVEMAAHALEKKNRRKKKHGEAL
jgi:hypothetical protein